MVFEWVLILWLHAGAWTDKDSMALATQQFATKELCDTAGKNAVKMTNGTVKTGKYVCERVK
jgi:hypothetical protein